MNEFNFRVVHMGINGGSKEEAAKIAKVFNALFGFESRETAISTFASNEKISSLSINFHASSFPPLISKVKMLAPPFGKYFSYNA